MCFAIEALSKKITPSQTKSVTLWENYQIANKKACKHYLKNMYFFSLCIHIQKVLYWPTDCYLLAYQLLYTGLKKCYNLPLDMSILTYRRVYIGQQTVIYWPTDKYILATECFILAYRLVYTGLPTFIYWPKEVSQLCPYWSLDVSILAYRLLYTGLKTFIYWPT